MEVLTNQNRTNCHDLVASCCNKKLHKNEGRLEELTLSGHVHVSCCLHGARGVEGQRLVPVFLKDRGSFINLYLEGFYLELLAGGI